MPIRPFHILLSAIATVAAITGIQLLAAHQNGYGIGATAVALTITNFVVTDVRARGARGDIRELAADIAEVRRGVRELAVLAKRRTLSDAQTHGLQNQSVQILTEVLDRLDGAPTGPQPINGRRNIRRVQ